MLGSQTSLHGAGVILDVEGLSIALPGGDGAMGVDGVSFSVEVGKTTCLVGESGSGKSLTALSILGLLPETFGHPMGRITFNGTNLLELNRKRLRAIRGADIGIVFQEPMTALNPLMRMEGQVAEVIREHANAPANAIRARVEEMLRVVSLNPSQVMNRYPHELSGGQRQRVMIAMALAMKPRLLIADEPTTALDVTTQAQILRIIADLREQQGTGVLFITHDFGIVADMADEVVVMRHARVVERGPSARILNDPQDGYTRALLDAVPKGRIGKQRTLETKMPHLVVSHMIKEFGGRRSIFGRKRQAVRAIDDVSFQIARGEILGIVGESGSGKSTLARAIARLIEPDSGSVTLDGEFFSALKGAELRKARNRMQVVFQDPYSSLNPRRRVGDTIAQGLRNYGVPSREASRQAEEMLELVGLPRSAATRFPNAFSGGQRQRICIARALVMKPRLLIADEAVSALDVSVQAQILTLLRDIREKFNLSVIFITHDLRVAAELCDQILVLKDGKMVEVGPCSEVLLTPQSDYTRALIEAIPGRRHFGLEAGEESAPGTIVGPA